MYSPLKINDIILNKYPVIKQYIYFINITVKKKKIGWETEPGILFNRNDVQNSKHHSKRNLKIRVSHKMRLSNEK